MSRWVIKGLGTGVVSTRYPQGEERAPGTSPGMPHSGIPAGEADPELAPRCPTGALSVENGRMVLDRAKCIHCFRCVRGVERPVPWKAGFEWASIRERASVAPEAFKGSMHIRVIDAGDCGACLNEVKLLNNPFYNMHRLGFFITPTPRQADILMVVGPVTDHMKIPLLKAYEAMPGPKRVMAVGACALNGGVFGPGFVAGSGVADVLPVDVEVPGWPPPPLAILHGLLTVAGRKTAERMARPKETGAIKEEHNT